MSRTTFNRAWTLTKIIFLSIPMLVITSSANIPRAAAIDDAQRKVINRGVTIYTLRDCAASSPETAAGNADELGDGGVNEKIIHDYLKAKGFTAIQIAGIMGNMAVESPGFKTDGTDGRAFGIAQWQDGRRVALNNFAAGRGVPNTDLMMQLDFLMQEFFTTEKRALAALQRAGNVRDAVTQFQEAFERCGKCHPERRIVAGEQIYAKYGGDAGGGNGQIIGPDGAAVEGGDTAAGQGEAQCEQENGDAGGAGIVDGIAFPLLTTQGAIKANGMWCFDKPENCHHDYNAADIGIGTGTQVVAAKEGTVLKTTNGRMASVHIKGADNNIYYYTHMGAGTVSVAQGAPVAIAAPLGKVGTSADAMGTPPHLHLDAQPPPATGRPSCAGAACARFNFINIQPPLIRAFTALPQ